MGSGFLGRGNFKLFKIMSATIINLSSAGESDKGASVGSGSIARKLSIGSDWTRLRIGLRWTIDDTGVDIVNQPICAFGLTAGTSSLYMGSGSSCNHFLGVISAASGSGIPIFPSSIMRGSTWYPVMTSSYGNPLAHDNNKVEGTFTIWNVVGNTYNFGINYYQNLQELLLLDNLIGIGDTVGNRTYFMLDITKGSPWKVGVGYYFDWVGSEWDDIYNLSKLKRWCTQVDPPYNLNYHHLSNTSSISASIDESVNGYLDTVMFYWSHTTPAINISDVVVAKIF